MEFLKFIFSSPWIWLGFLILVCCVLKYTVDLVSALRAKRKVHTFKTSDGSWQVLVENASHNDVEAAMVRQELREHLREQLKDKEVDQND
ncbi:hypothetical protein CE91St47_15470 [Eubacteriales bacterium]|nr:hypothetical protein CE91St47_15470 [Eubacteriales bacterium]